MGELRGLAQQGRRVVKADASPCEESSAVIFLGDLKKMSEIEIITLGDQLWAPRHRCKSFREKKKNHPVGDEPGTLTPQ